MTRPAMNYLRHLILCLALLASIRALAAPGDLDPSFNGTGKVTTAIGTSDDSGQAVAVQGDGKILVAGYVLNGSIYDLVVLRYNADATLDTSFGGGDGIATAGFGGNSGYGYSVTVQSDGKIVVAGQTDNGSVATFAVARFNTDGTLDTSFDGDGKVTTVLSVSDVASTVAVQGDGKIVVGGYSYNGSNADFAVVRYNANGSLDTAGFGATGTTFTGTGKVTTAIGSGDDYGNMALQGDGKIVMAGSSHNGSNNDFAAVRYNTNGTLDTTFNGTGKVTTPIGSGGDAGSRVVVQGDGKIVVAGSSSNGSNDDFALVRYTTTGALDTSFGGTGKVVTAIGSGADNGQNLVVQGDGKIVVAGSSNNGSNFDFALARYNVNGTLDTTFNGTGKVTTAIGSGEDLARGVALQADGKIVVSGRSHNGSNFDFVVARYLASDPPAAATATPTAVTGTSATLQGAVNPSGVAATAYFEYGPTTLYGSTSPVQNLAAGGSVVNVSGPISGLTPGGTYHYRMVASNAGGTARGLDQSFQATPAVGENPTAAPTVTTGGFSTAMSTSVTIQGTVNPNGGTTQAQVEYGSTTSYGSVSAPAQNVGNATVVANVSLPVTGLQPLTTYHYRVIASNSLGSSGGVDQTFTTAGIPPEVHTVAADPVASTSATLRAEVTANTGATSVAFLYGTSADVLTQIAPVPGGFPASNVAQSVALALPTGTLANTTTYFYRAIATSGAGTTNATEVLSFTTQNGPPVAVDDPFIIFGEDALKVLANDTDPDGDALLIASVQTPTDQQLGTAVKSTDGKQITFTPGDFFPTSADGDSFTYTIDDGHGGTDEGAVQVYSIRVLKGLYTGLIGGTGDGADQSGRLDIMITATGQVTGSFTWQGQVYPFKGAPLDSSGRLTVTKQKSGLPAGQVAVVEITLQLDPATRLLTGTLTDTETTPATVVQAKVTGTAGAEDLADLAEAGIYTSYIDPGVAEFAPAEGAPEAGASAVLLPKGVGFTQITVTRGGRRPARFAGRMPDDQPFTSGVRALAKALRGGGYTFRNDALYRTRNARGRVENRGFVSGDVGFSKSGSQFNSELNWERGAGVGTRFPAGFRTGVAGLRATLNAIKYGRPAPGVLPGGIVNDTRAQNAKVELRDESDPAAPILIVRNLKLTRSGSGPVRVKVEPANAALNVEKLKLSINPAKGTFTGSFVHPNDAALPAPPVRKFSGVFKNQDGQGVFTGPTTNTGRITILAQ